MCANDPECVVADYGTGAEAHELAHDTSCIFYSRAIDEQAESADDEESCGDVQITPLQNIWLDEQHQQVDSGKSWRYFNVDLQGAPQALAVEVLPKDGVLLQVALCPHCPKDGQCQGAVVYG